MRFRYLQWRRIIALTIILTLSSMLSSMTAFSLLSFYRGLSAYMGESEDIIVIYDVKSRTPFTGLVPAFLTERITAINSVLACSPEIVVPCIIKGETVFLRGVLPEEFLRVSNLTIVDGEMLDPRDLNSAVIGIRASKRIGLRSGEKALVTGVLTSSYLELRIKGVFVSGTALDDEIIAPLHVGQWLRGSGYSHVTIIRVKVSRGTDVRRVILNSIAESSLKPNQPSEQDSSGILKPPEQPVRWAATYFKVEDIGVENAERFMENYIERYGVTKETILVLSIITLIFSGATILLAAQITVSQHSGEIEILRYIGASRNLLRRDLILKLAPVPLLASALGIGLAIALLTTALGGGLLQVLFHSVQLQTDALTIASIISAILAITIIGVWRAIR